MRPLRAAPGMIPATDRASPRPARADPAASSVREGSRPGRETMGCVSRTHVAGVDAAPRRCAARLGRCVAVHSRGPRLACGRQPTWRVVGRLCLAHHARDRWLAVTEPAPVPAYVPGRWLASRSVREPRRTRRVVVGPGTRPWARDAPGRCRARYASVGQGRAGSLSGQVRVRGPGTRRVVVGPGTRPWARYASVGQGPGLARQARAPTRSPGPGAPAHDERRPGSIRTSAPKLTHNGYDRYRRGHDVRAHLSLYLPGMTVPGA